MGLKFKERDRVRFTAEVNCEGWFFREGDEAEVIAVFPLVFLSYHVRFTKTNNFDKYVGHMAACAEYHIELIDRVEKARFDHDKERSQIRGAKIDWFQLNEEFSSK